MFPHQPNVSAAQYPLIDIEKFRGILTPEKFEEMRKRHAQIRLQHAMVDQRVIEDHRQAGVALSVNQRMIEIEHDITFMFEVREVIKQFQKFWTQTPNGLGKFIAAMCVKKMLEDSEAAKPKNQKPQVTAPRGSAQLAGQKLREEMRESIEARK